MMFYNRASLQRISYQETYEESELYGQSDLALWLLMVTGGGLFHITTNLNAWENKNLFM